MTIACLGDPHQKGLRCAKPSCCLGFGFGVEGKEISCSGRVVQGPGLARSAIKGFFYHRTKVAFKP